MKKGNINLSNITKDELSTLELLVTRGIEKSRIHDDNLSIEMGNSLLSQIHELQRKMEKI